jgi:3-oxoadipate enol-lactonase
MLLQRDGRRLHYDLVGEPGRGTVCCAHALAADTGMWAEQVPALLDRGLQVLRIDMRGHGGSTSTDADCTLFDLAADVVAVLDALDVARVHFVGLSIGGMIGEALALRHAGMLMSMMLCEAPPASLPNADALWAPRIAAAEAANSLEPVADATMERWLTPAFKARRPGRWREIRNTVAATSVPGYRACASALRRFDFTRELPAVRTPTLVLYGEDDVASSAEEAGRLAKLIPGGRFVLFPGARHLPNVEAPERFNRILTDWIESCAGQPGKSAI